MNVLKTLLNSLAISALLTIPMAGNAADVLVDSSLFGTTQTQTLHNFAVPAGLTWNITKTGSTYTYTYTITPSVSSNYTIYYQVSSILTTANVASMVTGLPSTTIGNQATNPSIYGINFQRAPAVPTKFTFTSTLAPIWGSILIFNQTSNIQSANNQFGVVANSGSSLATLKAGWIPVVGNVAVTVPEPGTWLILGSSLMLVLFLSKQKIRLRIS